MTDFSRGHFQKMLTFATKAEMQTAGDFNENQVALLLGDQSTGDGTMRFFRWNSQSTAADEADSTLDVIAVTNQSKGRWEAIDGEVTTTETGDFTASGGSKSGKTIRLDQAAGQAVTLPDATGSGKRYDFVVTTTITSNTTTIKAPDADNTFIGNIISAADGGDSVNGYEAGGTDDTLTLDGSTTGGIQGDRYTFVDIGPDLWLLIGVASATGTEATPLSATV